MKHYAAKFTRRGFRKVSALFLMRSIGFTGRIFLYGIKFRDHANLLGSYGGVILTSLYVHDWGYQFDLNKDPLLTLAENYVRAFPILTLEDRAQKALGLFTKYDLNGMIMFMNRSCKVVSFAVPTLKDILTKKTGLPALIFESDMGDPRFYSETQIRTRVEAYFETLDRFHFSRETN
jgi:hypothetical protein